MSERKFDNWMNAYVDYTSSLRSPVVFRKWAALSVVSGGIGRQAFVRVTGQMLFPNLYVLLVSNPGIGKSNAIKFARRILKRVGEPKPIKVTPSRITKRALYNVIEASVATVIRSSAEMYQHCSVTAMIDEFGVFVKPNDTEFMVDLTDVYDCPELMDYETATQGDNKAVNVFFNLIGGTTPKYLKEAWTSSVLDQGFPARIILVYSTEQIHPELFGQNDDEDAKIDHEYETALAEDLKLIHDIHGRFTWEEKAQKEMVGWFNDGMPPRPTDPRMEHYNTRRHVHMLKLCMLMSAAKRDDMEIIKSDLDEARELIIEVESRMPEAIKGIGANPIRDQMIMVQKFVEGSFARTKKAVPEYKIRDLLMNELDPYRVPTMLQEMIIGQWVSALGNEPDRIFLPGLKQSKENL